MPIQSFAHPVLARGRSLIACAWACPLSLAGLAVSALVCIVGREDVSFAVVRRHSASALWLSSPALAWLLRRHPAGPMLALSLGQVVLARDPLQACSTELVRHELCHVQQAQRWGLFFPFAYSLASLLAGAQGEGAYWGNAFEREARAAEVGDPAAR